MDSDTASPASTSRSDALSRATALASRARDLRRAQGEVQDITSREVQMLARTAASFFDAIPLPEFTASLLPLSARQLRRMRHRILHRTVHTTASGTLIHAMLLGRDGVLRLFSARTADSRDLLRSLEPGRPLPPSVVRDVVEWTPTLRVSGFRPFEILEKLSGSLDAVEAQIADAEEKVQVQKQALATGDLSALLPGRTDRSARAQLSAGTRDEQRETERETEREAERTMLAAFDAADSVDVVRAVDRVDSATASTTSKRSKGLGNAAVARTTRRTADGCIAQPLRPLRSRRSSGGIGQRARGPHLATSAHARTVCSSCRADAQCDRCRAGRMGRARAAICVGHRCSARSTLPRAASAALTARQQQQPDSYSNSFHAKARSNKGCEGSARSQIFSC